MKEEIFNEKPAFEILNHYEGLTRHFEIKANWLIGISSLVLIFIISNFGKFNANIYSKIGAIVLIIGPLLSIYLLIGILIPYIFKSKAAKQTNTLKNNLLNFRAVQRKMTKEDVIKQLRLIRTDSKRFDEVLGNKIYDICLYRLPDRSNKLKLVGWLFMASLFIGALLIIIGSYL